MTISKLSTFVRIREAADAGESVELSAADACAVTLLVEQWKALVEQNRREVGALVDALQDGRLPHWAEDMARAGEEWPEAAVQELLGWVARRARIPVRSLLLRPKDASDSGTVGAGEAKSLRPRTSVYEDQESPEQRQKRFLRSQAGQLRRMIAQLPEGTMSGRAGLESRLEDVERELAELEAGQ